MSVIKTLSTRGPRCAARNLVREDDDEQNMKVFERIFSFKHLFNLNAHIDDSGGGIVKAKLRNISD